MSSCDTFVVFPPLTVDGAVIFGKNSDRPQGEVQEIVYFPPRNNSSGAKLKVTYIEIDDIEGETQAVILSKPSWMWGAEMGANTAGVVIGNEAVHTKVEINKAKDSLLGMDLVRLGLERGKSACDTVDVLTSLLEKYGQGGPCNSDEDLFYHNSFLIVDTSEAWVLEAAGQHWAAEKVTSGHRNISNCLSITTNIDKMSDNLINYAIENGLWDKQGEFNFKEAYMSGGSCAREASGRQLLDNETKDGFSIESMFRILRDKESGICRSRDDPFHTASSHVSVLSGLEKPAFHWFTGTPDPSMSVFKPFAFTPNSKISQHTVSPPDNTEDRRHNLYKLHESAHSKADVVARLQSMEAECVSEVRQLLDNFTPGQPTHELDDLLKDIVETEVRFYK